MIDFYLVSTELREPYKPRACQIVRQLSSELRDDLALVRVVPPLARHIYDTDEDLEFVILASRHQNTTLFPITRWPLAVYICRTQGKCDAVAGVIASVDLTILDWGEIRNAST